MFTIKSLRSLVFQKLKERNLDHLTIKEVLQVYEGRDGLVTAEVAVESQVGTVYGLADIKDDMVNFCPSSARMSHKRFAQHVQEVNDYEAI